MRKARVTCFQQETGDSFEGSLSYCNGIISFDSYIPLQFSITEINEIEYPSVENAFTGSFCMKQYCFFLSAKHAGFLVAIRDVPKDTQETKKSRYIPRQVLLKVIERDGLMCRFCGSLENIQLDHIIPFSLGGSNDVNNLQILCQSCNQKKSDSL